MNMSIECSLGIRFEVFLDILDDVMGAVAVMNVGQDSLGGINQDFLPVGHHARPRMFEEGICRLEVGKEPSPSSGVFSIDQSPSKDDKITFNIVGGRKEKGIDVSSTRVRRIKAKEGPKVWVSCFDG